MSSPAELFEDRASRYVVGIDLGTTNSAVCYLDSADESSIIRVLGIPQFVAPGQLETRDTLPSFHYEPPAGNRSQSPVQSERWSDDLRPSTFGLSPDSITGFLARDYGSATPGRLISSAKSWLCHTGVDRTAELLPWHAASDVQRISPVEASSRYLRHIRAAWNARFAGEPLERQDIVLTLPASFDEIARELTVAAARQAGLARVVLIEEPQAAFYAWINKHRENWDALVSPGQTILVCDVGGGTTDFTLIRVEANSAGTKPARGAPHEDAASARIQFHRVAVGDHLLLGGDNMDLALAQHLEAKLTARDVSRSPGDSSLPGSRKLPPHQWDTLLRYSRQVKERMLSADAPEQMTVTLPASGSKLLGGGLSTSVTRQEVRELVVDGFMPLVPLDAAPLARRSGFQEFGLPYAADSAITRYLAAFLTAHADRGQLSSVTIPAARPDILLFNGGVFESPVLRHRLIDCLHAWFPPADLRPSTFDLRSSSLAVLDNDRLDLAVARGAAYYGLVRRGAGVKIVASLARTYYIGLEAAQPLALCLVPGSAEPGQTIEVERQFDLLVSEPVEFPLYTSSTRLTDQPGELVPFDPEQMKALPPIRTALKVRSRRERGTVAVRLNARLTEIGTLELWCREIGGERTWRLQFDVRSATQTDVSVHQSDSEAEGFVDESIAAACRATLDDTFSPAGAGDPATLMKRLIAAAGSDRHEWPTSLLRRIWEMLLELEPGRRRSPQHEARWLNLLGYCLRPGYGLAVDDWRVAETWKTVQGKLAHSAATSRTEALILWRRIAGGLPAGQQRALAEPLVATVRTLHKRHSGGAKVTEAVFHPHEALEVLRLLGALELLNADVKVELGRLLLDLVPKKKLEPIRPALLWAIARLGARQPAYGPLNTVIPAAEATDWIDKLIHRSSQDAITQFAVVNLARRTQDRFRDIDEAAVGQVLEWLEHHQTTAHSRQLVLEGGQLDRDDQTRIFGESLPKGLRLR